MRTLRFGISFLIIVLPLCVLLAGSYRLVRSVFRYINSNPSLAATVSEEASVALNRKVRVREVRISGNLWGLKAANTVELRGVTVADEPETPGRPFASADSVVLHYTLDQVLYGDARTPYVTGLQLVRPSIHLKRDNHGRWNFADLTRPKAKAGRVFTDQISVSAGSLMLHDDRFPAVPSVKDRPLLANLSDVNGTALVRPDKSVAFDFRGRPNEQIAEDFQLAGVVDMVPVRIAARLKSDRVNVPAIVSRFVPTAVAVVPAGNAALDVSAVYAPGRDIMVFKPNSLQVAGKLRLEGCSGQLRGIHAPLREVTGAVEFTNTSCSAQLSGLVDNVPLHINVAANGLANTTSAFAGLSRYLASVQSAPPVVHLDTTVPSTDLSRLYRDVGLGRLFEGASGVLRHAIDRVGAEGSVSLDVEGNSNNPTIALRSHLNRASYDNVRASNMDLVATISNHLLTAAATGTYAGGHAAVRGSVNLDATGSFHVNAQGRAIHINGIGFRLNALQDGVGDVDFAISGRKGRTPNLTAQVQVKDLKLNNQTFQSAYGDAESVGRNLTLRTLRVDDLKGFALASGSMNLSTHALNVQVNADGIDLQALVGALRPSAPLAPDPNVPSLANLDGTAFIRNGVVSGTWEAPVLNADVLAFGVTTGKYKADRATATIRLNASGVVIGEGVLDRYPARVRFEGSVTALQEPRPAFDFNMQAADLDLANMADIIGVDTDKYKIEGTISTDDPAGIHIFGSRGEIRAEAAGGTGKPFAISLKRASVNGLKLTTASATAFYDRAGVHLVDSDVKTAGGSLRIAGLYGPGGAIDADVFGSGLSLARLTPVLPASVAPELDGDLTFHAHIAGADPDIRGDAAGVTVKSIRYRDLALGSVSFNSSYSNQLFTFTDLKLSDRTTGSTIVTAPNTTYNRTTGALDSPDTASDKAIQIVDAPVSEIQDLINTISGNTDAHYAPITLADLKGGLSARVRLSGTLENPAADVLLDSSNLAVKDYLITRAVGSAHFSRDGVSGNSAVVTIRPAGASAQPQAEAQLATVSVRDFSFPAKGDIKADIDISNLNLSFLQAALQPGSEHRITGTADKIGMLLGGTMKEPTVELSVSLSKLTYMDRTIDRVELNHAQVQQGEIRVDDLRVTKTDPGGTAYQASASGTIKGFSWSPPYLPDSATLDVTAEVPRNAHLNARADLKLLSDLGLSVFKDRVGTFGASLKINGTIAAPKLDSGFLELDADRLTAPALQTALVGVSTRLDIADDIVTVNRFTARTQVTERKGMVNVTRTGDPIELHGSIPVGYGDPTPRSVANPLTLTAKGIQFEETPLPAARTGGLSGSATANITVTRSLLRPLIGGVITVSNSSISLPNDFTPGAASSGAPLIDPRFDLTLNLEGKANHLRNPQLDARVSGFLSLRGDLAAPVLHGHISLNQGYLRVPPRQFDIVPPGSIDIDYGNAAIADAGLNVRIGVTARTKLSAISVTGVRRLYTVTVSANGPLNDTTVDPITGQSRMRLDYTTEPNDLANSQQALSERLVTALFGVDTFDRFGRDPGQTTLSALSNVFTGYVLPGEFNRVASGLGLEQLAINYDPIEQLAIMVSRQIVGPLYVTYNRGITAENRYYDVKMSLRFRDRYQLSYEFDDTGVQQYLIEGVWRF